MSKTPVVYKSNILMAHYVIWFRYVRFELLYPFDGGKSWKSLKQNNLIVNVWKNRKISLNLIFDELYLSNNDDIENKIISNLGMMEAIKLWIEGKMDEDDSVNLFFSKMCNDSCEYARAEFLENF